MINKENGLAIKAQLKHGDISKIAKKSNLDRRTIYRVLEGNSNNSKATKAVLDFIENKTRHRVKINKRATSLVNELTA